MDFRLEEVLIKQSHDHPVADRLPQASSVGRNSINPSVNREEKTSKSGGTPSNQPSNQGNGGVQKGALASKKCYLCGKYGHYRYDCPRNKQVNMAHVPSLAKVANDAITVPGQVGEMPVAQMLCDSGATMSVVIAWFLTVWS